MSERACENCEFWEERTSEKLGLGECRRFPPPGTHPLMDHLVGYIAEIGRQLCPDEPSGEWIAGRNKGWFHHIYVSPVKGDFAITDGDDWCGEFKPTQSAEQSA